MRKVAYNDNLDGTEQVDAEELIAATIHDRHGVDISERTAQDLGRDILYKILRKFRPDLFVKPRVTRIVSNPLLPKGRRPGDGAPCQRCGGCTSPSHVPEETRCKCTKKVR